MAVTLDCRDREAIAFIGTTAGVTSEHVRDMMVEAVERRFGLVNRLPSLIEWLSDNESCYVVRDTRLFVASLGMILEPRRSRARRAMAWRRA